MQSHDEWADSFFGGGAHVRSEQGLCVGGIHSRNNDSN